MFVLHSFHFEDIPKLQQAILECLLWVSCYEVIDFWVNSRNKRDLFYDHINYGIQVSSKDCPCFYKMIRQHSFFHHHFWLEQHVFLIVLHQAVFDYWIQANHQNYRGLEIRRDQKHLLIYKRMYLLFHLYFRSFQKILSLNNPEYGQNLMW